MSEAASPPGERDPRRRLRALAIVLLLVLVTSAPALLPLARGEVFSHRDVLTFFLQRLQKYMITPMTIQTGLNIPIQMKISASTLPKVTRPCQAPLAMPPALQP